MKNDSTYLSHIREAIQNIQDYLRGAWDTCKNDLPSLKGFVAAILDE
jgi:uncharacterized protein with HEPN domain